MMKYFWSLGAGLALACLVAAAPAHAQTTTTYAYDALGRLTSAATSDGSSVSYAYDAAGNRTQVGTVAVLAPTAGNVSLTVAYNTSGTVTLTPAGSYTSLAMAIAPAHGAATISGTTATYTPTSGYAGADSFTYTATGPGGTSTPGTVSVTVSNQPAPTVANVSLSVAYNTSGLVTLVPSGSYTALSIASAPAHGTATISGTTATYTPTSGYAGADSFTYTATGPGGTSAPASVSVTVGNPPAAPTAGNVSANVPYNTATVIALAPGGSYTALSLVTAPTHGTASISGTTATYTPISGYTGSDSFTYHVTGPGGTSAAATVSITIPTPPAPTAGAVNMSVAFGGAASASLAPGGAYTSLVIVTAPGLGTASISGTRVTYTMGSYAFYQSTDTFTYRAIGPGGNSAVATVTVSIGLPPPPTAGTASLSLAYNTSGTILVPWNGVVTTISTASAPSKGTVSWNTFTAKYTPNLNSYGADSFTYRLTGPGGSATGTINVTVAAPPALSASVSSTSYIATKYGTDPVSYDANLTVSATGGIAPYSYVWQYVSGDTSIINEGGTTSTWWSRASFVPYTTWVALWRCKVTDSAGTVSYSPNVTITLSHVSG